MSKAKLLLAHPDLGVNVFYKFEIESGIYYLFSDEQCERDVGEAETKPDAFRIAREYFEDLMQ